MYSFFSQISSFLSEPFFSIVEDLKGIPVLFAFTLGIVGALAPCQFVTNISAITLFGNRSLQRSIVWKDVFWFIVGKILAFSLFGILFWLLGRGVQETLTLFFPWLQKLIGPLLLLVGLYLIGFIPFKVSINLIKDFDKTKSESFFGDFFLGFSFSLAFCPTMFVLFFITLMPVSITSSSGFLLPPIFALGTAIPLIISMYLIWELGEISRIKKKGRKVGVIVQRGAGAILILLGAIHMLMFWY
ncbi:sulfite exporter TauE/SafE family protein [Peribacillus acanthi]|uniref:urease accessory protein UreH domain-containing protein n=1 Tax=Peribacillus acanthi TaxID=2171554 RepID=UPI000D3EDA6C|nr:sulfite exporter TauE/SafE family protein [Peribacillus acanthi]